MPHSCSVIYQISSVKENPIYSELLCACIEIQKVRVDKSSYKICSAILGTESIHRYNGER